MEENARKTESGLSLYHPVVSFGYFVAVIAGALLFVHPVYGMISLLTAVLYSSLINDRKTLGLSLGIGIPMVFFISVINPLFNHRGITVLFYIHDNPVTLEATLYGLCSALMMFSAIMWFTCYNTVITSDKFLYIFGRILPSVALVISMTLTLIPKLFAQLKIISDAQRSMGLDWKSGTVMQRIRAGSRILSILVSWALEDAVVTADSMSARGYGIGRRSCFSVFSFGKRDLRMLAVILLMLGAEIAAYVSGSGTMTFYPYMIYPEFKITDIVFYVSYLALGLLPSIIHISEDRKWKQLA